MKKGRPLGSGNKPLSRLLADRIEAKYKDFNPVLSMLDDAMKLKALSDAPEAEAKDHTTSLEAMEKVARFLTPTLKAIENTGSAELTVKRQIKRYDGKKNPKGK